MSFRKFKCTKSILLILIMITSINIANSQNYRPKKIVQKLGNSSMPLKLKWAIKLDSNYAISYYKLAKYYKEKRNYLTNKGSIYYYYIFFEVNNDITRTKQIKEGSLVYEGLKHYL